MREGDSERGFWSLSCGRDEEEDERVLGLFCLYGGACVSAVRGREILNLRNPHTQRLVLSAFLFRGSFFDLFQNLSSFF